MAYTTNKLTVKRSGDNPAIEIDGDIKQVGYGTIKVAGITVDNYNNAITIPGNLVIGGATTIQTIQTGTITATNTDTIDMIATGTPTGKQVGPLKGVTYLVSGDFAFDITLPSTGVFVGDWVRFVHRGTNNCDPTFKGRGGAKISALGNLVASSITLPTSHRIGSVLTFIYTGSISSNPTWHLIPMGVAGTDYTINA